jgi:hypothetical protein
MGGNQSCTIWSGPFPVCEAIWLSFATSSGAKEISIYTIVGVIPEPKQSTIKNQQSTILSSCLRVSVVK